jgi:Flp pilus assembly protein protease CpaA
MLSPENLFLFILGLIWIIGAILQDLKRREVDNIWNFSLVFFALAYRASVSVFSGDYWFWVNGLLGLGIFLFIGNLFYYSRIFAGGDAKLLIALGAVLPLSADWIINFKIFGLFIFLLLTGGALYVAIWALILAFWHLRKFLREFHKQSRGHRNWFAISFVLYIVWAVLIYSFGQTGLVLAGLVILLFPLLLVFSKAVEESCLIRQVSPKEVTEGDWLYEDIYVAGKKIKSSWEGVSERELSLIKRRCRRKILIRQGIPFTPGFLIAFIGLIIVFKYFNLF